MAYSPKGNGGNRRLVAADVRWRACELAAMLLSTFVVALLRGSVRLERHCVRVYKLCRAPVHLVDSPATQALNWHHIIINLCRAEIHRYFLLFDLHFFNACTYIAFGNVSLRFRDPNVPQPNPIFCTGPQNGRMAEAEGLRSAWAVYI